MSLAVHYCPNCGVGFKIKEFDAVRAQIESRPPRQRACDLVPESVRSDYEAGASVLELSSKYGSSPYSIASRIRSLGGTIRPAGSVKGSENGSRKIPCGDIGNILKLDVQGVRHSAIASKFGVTRERIRQICMEHGQPTRLDRVRTQVIQQSLDEISEREKKHAAHDIKVSEASRLWKKGEPVKDVAQVLGLTFNQFRGQLDSWRRRNPSLFPLRIIHAKRRK